ncbi:MAG: hypothetical protein GQ541_07335 [Desulfovibrionaceae bacterium]|nr:hypothetical protein [Desulfovibrionaceae bacterium]
MSNKKLATVLAACGAGALLFGIAVSSLAADKMIKVGDKEYPLKKVDELSDFANPRRFELPMKNVDGEMMKITPEGVPFAWDKPRKHMLEKEYLEVKFPVDKVFAGVKAASKGGGCLTCHDGIEAISDTHDFACVQCHQGDDRSSDMKAAHAGMFSNPSDGTVVAKTCGTANCHEDQMHKVDSSLMATSAGEINATRYAWGAQSSVDAIYSVNGKGGTKMIPTEKESGQLVDDMLRKKCLRCHINSPAPNRLGDYRATGCAACHMIYANDGQTITGDKAIQKTQTANNEAKERDVKLKTDLSGLIAKRGYPMKHRLTTAIPTVQCVRCHSGNRVGTEYIGLFEHDYEKMYRSPRYKWNAPLAPYGIDHHTLMPDIHFKAGLACIDCHTSTEMMGNGKTMAAAHEATEVTCETCHGTPGASAQTAKLAKGDAALKAANANPNYSAKAGDVVAVTAKGTKMANVKKTSKGMVLTSKVTGKQHVIPQLMDVKNQPTAHKVAGHMASMECSACHSGWVSMDFGTHLMREDYPSYKKWKRWREPDPQTLKLLYAALGSGVGDKMQTVDRKFKAWDKDQPAQEMDWLNGEKSTGIWFGSMTMRNWEDVILGKNPEGKYSMFRPQYQYFISHLGPDVGKLRKEEMNIKKKLLMTSDPDERLKIKLALREMRKKVKAQIFMDSQLVKTTDGMPGLVMNAYTPHTIQTVGRRCEECHTNGEAAGLGRSTFYKAEDTWAPQLDSGRAGLPIDFQIKQVVSEDGEPLQITTQKGARFLNKKEMDALLNKSDAYRAMRYQDLQEKNYGALLSRDTANLPGGAKRMVKEGISNGDVRKVGSYYDQTRYGFWQTDPVVFSDDYFKKGLKKKTGKDVWNEPVVREEKKVIEAGSRTYLTPENTNFNWIPADQQ